MLTRLMVKDFALIHHIELEFDHRFTVLTGETGAGKSIIIDAVSLLLGARANSRDIRYGCKKAIVEGTFEIGSQPVLEQLLEELGHTLEEDRQLILYREISDSGKHVCRVNDRTTTLSSFRQIGQLLINIYGQHDFQSISDREQHLALLDSLGDSQFQQEKEKLAEAYRAMAAILQKKNRLQQAMAERRERLEFLQFKLRELEELHLNPGEEEQIEQELLVLDNYEKISTATGKAYQLVYGDTRSIYAQLTAVMDQLQPVRQYEKSLDEMVEGLQNMLYTAEDYGFTLSGFHSKMEFDEDRREQLNARKYVLDKAKRKYARSIEELIQEQVQLAQEIGQLEHADEELEDLEQAYREKKQLFVAQARVVRQGRQQLAQLLTVHLLEHLKDLAMHHTRFEVKIEDGKASAQGLDAVEFYLSANPGQPLRPLSEIASGGEMSRIMLAFKTVLARYEQIDTLIFDEIDTGIGGNIVVKVAEKLVSVSKHGQVICVTHAPQIAAMAHRHFRIAKEVADNETITRVTQLSQQEEIVELARMLGGEEAFQLQHAQELKRKAAQI